MLIKIEDNRFWDNIDQFKLFSKFYSSLYENQAFNFYKLRFQDEGYKITDKSFMVCENEIPVLIFFGSILEKTGTKILSANELPCMSFEADYIPKKSQNIIKNYFKNEIFGMCQNTGVRVKL